MRSSFFENFNGHVGKCAEDFEGMHKRSDIGKRTAKVNILPGIYP